MNSKCTFKTESTFFFICRIFILILCGTTILLGNINSLINNSPFSVDKYFTYQSNILVLIWIFFAIYRRIKSGNLDAFYGSVHGAITVYISFTFIVYTIILYPINPPSGFQVFTIFIHHILTPIYFMLDYLYTEKKEIKWAHILPWMIYPHIYIFFSLISGSLTGDYIYFFLDYKKLGLLNYLYWYIVVIAIFLSLSVIIIGYTKYLNDYILFQEQNTHLKKF